jgi:hypothetical protein
MSEIDEAAELITQGVKTLRERRAVPVTEPS